MKKRIVGCLLMLVLGYSAFGQTTYTWNGTTSDWTVSTNWTPTRTPATNDILVFDASSAIKNITNVPSQTLGEILVTGSSAYTFVPIGGQILTLTSTAGTAFQIDNGSTLSNGAVGNPLNFDLPIGGSALIGGQLNLVNGNFDASSATLTLHTNSSPLARTSGQVSLDATSVLKLGDASNTTGANIVLPNNIFVSAPIISSLIMNRTNGATLGDQSITVISSATFTLGDLTTNGAGRIKFSTTAASPIESSTSKIIGYAEMNTRTLGINGIDFLGFDMASGTDDIGFFSIVRRTGLSGRNTFNANESIDATWDINSGANPASGRNVVFKWLPEFDNGTIPTNTFQPYIFNSGPGWSALGTLQPLTASSPLRQSTVVSVIKLDDTFTLTDQNSTLPVELTSFFARASASNLKLSWQTASEKINDFFIVEKMKADQTFEAIGKVKGAGTTVTQTNYSFVDEKPRLGDNYYRLKQIDEDGKFVYSHVVHASFDGKAANSYSIYPNPSDGKQLYFDNVTEDFAVSFQDVAGSVIFNSNVRAEDSSLDISALQLPIGFYFVRTLTKGKSQIHKLIVK